MNIPQCHPQANYLAHKEKIDSAINKVLAGGRYILGEEVAAFEKEFARYLGVNRAVSVASGTDAIELALRAVGVGRGDTVVTVSHTAVATVAAIARAGATPLFADIDPATYTLCPRSLTAVLAKAPVKPKALVPVHLYGHPADMDAIGAIAAQNGLTVIEDCAQAHGAEYHGRKVGSFGELSAFSFYPTKNLGAIGDGGMVCTNNPALAEKVGVLRQYGWQERYISQVSGVNSRLDELQAAILRIKLPSLETENKRRIAIARHYSGALALTPLQLPGEYGQVKHVYHQYVVRHPQRERLKDRLKAAGIGTLIHYPLPVHLQPAYQRAVPLIVPLPHTEKIRPEILSLPIYPELADRDLDAIGAALIKISAAL